jgi:hypothetical protein
MSAKDNEETRLARAARRQFRIRSSVVKNLQSKGARRENPG